MRVGDVQAACPTMEAMAATFGAAFSSPECNQFLRPGRIGRIGPSHRGCQSPPLTNQAATLIMHTENTKNTNQKHKRVSQ